MRYTFPTEQTEVAAELAERMSPGDLVDLVLAQLAEPDWTDLDHDTFHAARAALAAQGVAVLAAEIAEVER